MYFHISIRYLGRTTFIGHGSSPILSCPGGPEGLSTKIVATFEGVLDDSNFGDFEADGSLPFGNLVQSGTRNGLFQFSGLIGIFGFRSPYSPVR